MQKLNSYFQVFEIEEKKGIPLILRFGGQDNLKLRNKGNKRENVMHEEIKDKTDAEMWQF